MKNVKSSIVHVENSIRYFSPEEEKTQAKYDKYDRFLKEKTNAENDYNSPLLRTLNILESSQNDLSLLRSKLRS